jgi:hypothetical protein
MSDFNALFQTLTSSAEDYIKSNVKEHVATVITDTHNFLNDSKADLEKYTTQLAEGTISKSQFESLLLDMKDNLALEAALQAGLSQIRADQIRKGIVNLVIQVLFRIIP